jgi:alanyl-tRNA synthetase
MSTTSDIRQAFLSFFEGRGHRVPPSSSLVPHNDPTLMFANAGMNQFKNIFTGAERAPEPPRAATSQKCVRAGGKHNDLDNVGYTARHHTFFEMLGNFSFGDYFKEGAILYAWELLTKEYRIPPEKLYLTVYHTDDEAFALWKKISGFSDGRILRVPTKDNFWAMGDTGPCGPCSEIFYDHGEHAGAGAWALNADGSDRFGDRFVEIWNLVFMQYEQVDVESRRDLPKPSIDTGMGLERVAAVLQGVHDNYAIDLFRSLIAASESLTGTRAEGEHAASHKVIADHLRSCCFLLADGVTPSNEGRGYVLRRIMRRAMRHAHLLGANDPLMHRLVPALLATMGGAYPELRRAEALISETLRSEEVRFRETLERGLKLLEGEVEQNRNLSSLPGEIAFKLYDTYGFPLDLTEDILRGRGIGVDKAGFDAAMAEQKSRARAAWKGSGEAAVGALWFDLRERFPATEFLGYSTDTASAEVLALVQEGTQAEQSAAGASVLLLTNQTPFYAESGGQVGDTGWVYRVGRVIGEITNTTKPHPDFHIHHVTLTAPLAVGEVVELTIDRARRTRIRANHSATHLLHAALRRHLGEHVTQKGSLVDADRLRFDISHTKALTPEEIAAVEREVNRIIWQNGEVLTRLMKPEEAVTAGAMALFGEKYGEEVRVLSMGTGEGCGRSVDRPSPEPRPIGSGVSASGGQSYTPYSVELCGGTHVTRTGEIGLLKIISEGAVAAGVRRIEAVTQERAFSFLTAQDTVVKSLADMLKTAAADVPERLTSLLEERKKLQKELAEAKKHLALGGDAGGGVATPEEINGVAFIGKHYPDLPPKELRGVAEGLLKHCGAQGVVAVTSGFEGKGSVVVAVSPALTPRLSAVELVKHAVAALGGQGGGGRPEMAQGGGADGAQGEAALAAVRAALGALKACS